MSPRHLHTSIAITVTQGIFFTDQNLTG
uniref:Uncharacterized protein n=1 Tax=Arundo donax TaxID=35708 RepID=A0A0A9HB60_ARUDO